MQKVLQLPHFDSQGCALAVLPLTRFESPAVASSCPSWENSMLDSTSEPMTARRPLGTASRRARGTSRAGMGSGRSHQSGLKCQRAGSFPRGLQP